MQYQIRLAVLLVAFLALLTHSRSAAFNVDRHKREISDPWLTIAVLEQLINSIQEDLQKTEQLDKRNFDVGYGNRYGVAHSVGSKLMALKQAADWNGPGRKRRSADEIENLDL